MCRQADHPARWITIGALIQQFARTLTRFEQVAGFDQESNSGRRYKWH
jgi:hypothetical protein